MSTKCESVSDCLSPFNGGNAVIRGREGQWKPLKATKTQSTVPMCFCAKAGSPQHCSIAYQCHPFVDLQKGGGLCSEDGVCKLLEICYPNPTVNVNNSFGIFGMVQPGLGPAPQQFCLVIMTEIL